METDKRIGIWMDHLNAILIDANLGKITNTIESKFTHEVKVEALHHGESGMHHKEHQLQLNYYKQIAEEIAKYNTILLFGPTDAKQELHNYLMKQEHFKEIEMHVLAADKMTENEKIAFVRNHFNKVL